MNNLIEVLQDWYASQCNDVWEHSFGVEIVNIDNPGWRVKINGTSSKKVINLDSHRDDMNWVSVTATATEFIGYGGPGNLSEILKLAIDWLKYA